MNSQPGRVGNRVAEDSSPYQQMAIVERYEPLIEYLYPILQNAPRKHGVARDEVLKALFRQVDLFLTAGKSGQASRLYTADANLGSLRFWLRFLSAPGRKIITKNQHRVAEEHLMEVGAMLGSWIRTATKRKG